MHSIMNRSLMLDYL